MGKHGFYRHSFGAIDRMTRSHSSTRSAVQLCAPISAVPLLPWVIHKRTAIEILHNAMVPEASDDLAFTDLVRLAGP